MSKEDASYEIGYGKPPRSGQFTAGKSGNPKGRPNGSKNLATIIQQESRQRVRVNGPRGTRTVTKLEAAVMQLSNKSAQGELRASREFFALVRFSEENVDSSANSLPLVELDRPVIESIRRRMSNIKDVFNQEVSE